MPGAFCSVTLTENKDVYTKELMLNFFGVQEEKAYVHVQKGNSNTFRLPNSEINLYYGLTITEGPIIKATDTDFSVKFSFDSVTEEDITSVLIDSYSCSITDHKNTLTIMNNTLTCKIRYPPTFSGIFIYYINRCGNTVNTYRTFQFTSSSLFSHLTENFFVLSKYGQGSEITLNVHMDSNFKNNNTYIRLTYLNKTSVDLTKKYLLSGSSNPYFLDIPIDDLFSGSFRLKALIDPENEDSEENFILTFQLDAERPIELEDNTNIVYFSEEVPEKIIIKSKTPILPAQISKITCNNAIIERGYNCEENEAGEMKNIVIDTKNTNVNFDSCNDLKIYDSAIPNYMDPLNVPITVYPTIYDTDPSDFKKDNLFNKHEMKIFSTTLFSINIKKVQIIDSKTNEIVIGTEGDYKIAMGYFKFPYITIPFTGFDKGRVGHYLFEITYSTGERFLVHRKTLTVYENDVEFAQGTTYSVPKAEAYILFIKLKYEVLLSQLNASVRGKNPKITLGESKVIYLYNNGNIDSFDFTKESEDNTIVVNNRIHDSSCCHSNSRNDNIKLPN